MPNMVIMAPKDENELQHMVKTALEYDDGPIAIRFGRGKGLGVPLDNGLKTITIPSWEIVRPGHNIAILAVGSAVYPSIQAASILEADGFDITVVNARFVKPFDKTLLENTAQNHKYLITVEENSLAGGFGSAVLEYLSDWNILNTSLRRIGLPDRFIEHGPQGVLRDIYGLTPEKIAATIKEIAREKK